MNEKILKAIITNYSNNNKALGEKIFKITKGEFKSKEAIEILNSLDLGNLEKRCNFIWDCEYMYENSIMENIHEGDENLILEKVLDDINNKYNNNIFNHENFRYFISNRYIRNLNDMRVFAVCICEGDTTDFLQYAPNSAGLLSYCVLRTLAILGVSSKNIVTLGKNIMEYLIGDGNTFENIYRFNFKEREETLVKYKMFSIDNEPVFLEGMLKLIEGYYKSINEENKFNELVLEYKCLCEDLYTKICKMNHIETNKEINENEEYVEKNNLGDDVDTDISGLYYLTKEDLIDNEPSLNKSDINTETYDDCNKINDKDINIKLELNKKINEIKELIDSLEVKSKDEKLIDEKVDLRKEISTIKEENARLKKELEKLKEKNTNSVSIKDLVQKIGGKEYEYQLSELFLISEFEMNDDGNIPGRLINLFGAFSAYGIEAYMGCREINDEFEIDRKTLSKEYNLEMPLKGDDEIVKVKLIRNGWTYNNDIIVLPLVRQI